MYVIIYDMNENKKKISILGSTGSIGTQALEVIEKLQDKFEIISLSAGKNIELLKTQIDKFHPKYVCIADETCKDNYINGAKVFHGEEGFNKICSDKNNDIILVAVSGKVGLKPTLEAIKNGINIALANKETLVMAGNIVMKEAKKHNVNIIPVDSEHSAIFQCIKNSAYVNKLIITASGGPFLNTPQNIMENASIEQTLNHPRWKMGKKITVDSATLMNKGLEVIEAHHLFDVDYKNIDVVIHPQSIIHSAIEYIDGSVIAQLGVPSMHIPIQYALSYPRRCEGIKTKSFSFVEAGKLEFYAPDYNKFPCLKLACEAGQNGTGATIALNASNEIAVMSFLEGKIKLLDIYNIVSHFVNNATTLSDPSIEDIMNFDREIRLKTTEYIDNIYQR